MWIIWRNIAVLKLGYTLWKQEASVFHVVFLDFTIVHCSEWKTREIKKMKDNIYSCMMYNLSWTFLFQCPAVYFAFGNYFNKRSLNFFKLLWNMLYISELHILTSRGSRNSCQQFKNHNRTKKKTESRNHIFHHKCRVSHFDPKTYLFYTLV